MKENPTMSGAVRLSEGVTRGEPIAFRFEEREMPAYPGETVAGALLAAGVRTFRQSVGGQPRGYYCGMGVCFECRVRIDGRANQRACMTPVRAGMHVQVQRDETGEGARRA
jgi:predicted molibdopterin-dependent oxidoreductase YjgC